MNARTTTASTRSLRRLAGAAALALLVSVAAVPVLRRAGERRPTLDDATVRSR